MITHYIGADTTVEFDWIDADGMAITPSLASFEATGPGTAISYALGDAALTTSLTHSLALHLDDTLTIGPGNWQYLMRANDGLDWSIISSGLLRVRSEGIPGVLPGATIFNGGGA